MIDQLLALLQESRLLAPTTGAVTLTQARSDVPEVKRLLHDLTDTLPEESCMMLCEKYLSTLHTPNAATSLYDCLRSRLLLRSEGDYLVVRGSLSGIQRFLYDVRAKGALKNLRGRSFYLKLLLDAVVERILDTFGLTHTAVLYNSGGTCCLFIPCSDDTEARFAQLADQIRQQVFAYHGEAMVILNAVRASRHTLLHDLATPLSQLQRLKEHDKYAPLQGFTTEQCQQLFRAATPTSDSSARYIKLGGTLPQAECMVVSRQPLGPIEGVNPGGLGIYFYPMSLREVSRFAQEDSSLVCFNTHDLPVPSLPTRCDYVAGCGAPIQSFEELIDDDADFKRLGVLRMDVDNLGLLFRTLSSGDDALRRTATMSRRLDLFFKQELNELYMQHYSRSAVIIYSGGDDLFIVGEWTQTLAFAVAIHDHFTEAFRDTTLGLSGGVALVTAKYPIIRAAELSAAEEELSKRFVHGAARKNALSLFGIPMRWDVEFRAVWHCSEQLVDSIDAGAVDRSIIGRLQRYYANAHFEGQHLTPVRLIWLIGYDLSRLIGRNKRQEPLIRQYISDITTGSTLEGKYIDTPYHALQLLTVAARIAELRLRTSNR